MTSLDLRLNAAAKRASEALSLRALSEDGPRRLLNIAVAGAGLVVASPLMLLIAGAIRLTSRGPVIYAQTRVGLDRRQPGEAEPNRRRTMDLGGKPFTIYKFRTMRCNGKPSEAENQVWALADDPRITLVGRVLRQFRLDELPQLVNVLRGEMNVVGPRPEQPKIFAQLRERIPRYVERQRVRPGITGLAQISHPYDRSLDDVRRKLSFDLQYLERQSLLEDLWIMARTLPVMLLRRGAQ